MKLADIFKKQTKQSNVAEENFDANPYLAAKREWNERDGQTIANANNWRNAFLYSMAGTIISLIGVIYLGSLPKIKPYVVEINNLGEPVRVIEATTNDDVRNKIIKATLAEFIVDFRTICGDTDVQKGYILKMYDHLQQGSPAFIYLSDYLKQNSPFERMQKGRVKVQIISAISISDKSWQLDWQEQKLTSNGEEIGSAENYRAIAMINIQEPTNEKVIFKNPAGVWVQEFSFQKLLTK